jgi:transposase-like protein
MRCPSCYSKEIKKNGLNKTKNKQKYKCKECGKQFVLDPIKHPITESQKEYSITRKNFFTRH